MSWLDAIILGLVEGITEYLPVSSTGHLILVSALLGLDTPEIKPGIDAFNVVVQGGAILAVLGLYRARVAQMIAGALGRDAAGRALLINILIAFAPAVVLGLRFNDVIEEHLFHPVPVIAALAAGGVLMIAVGKGHRRSAAEPEEDGRPDAFAALTWRAALLIGFFQAAAMWPGTSRSMMTIVAGMLVGLSARRAAEFSFLLGLPTLGGACVYTLASNLKDAHDTGTPNMFQELGVVPTMIGLAVAAVSAWFAIRWLVGFLNTHGLGAFGWYRIVLAAGMAAAVLSGTVTFH